MAVDDRTRYSRLAALLVVALLHHTRPHVATLGVRASFAAWPARFAEHAARAPKLEWRGSKERNVDDLALLVVRWNRERSFPTHVGLLGAWVQLPTKDVSTGVVVLSSCASFAAFSLLAPGAAFRYFVPPHTGFSRPASFLLAPFAQRTFMGLIFSVIAAVSCGPELERRPGSGLSAVCLFVLCGFAALFVGTRVCDDRYAAGVASSGARLGWLAAVAARRPHMQFNVYGINLPAWAAVLLNAGLAAQEGGGGVGTIAGLASAAALGATYGYKLEHPGGWGS